MPRPVLPHVLPFTVLRLGLTFTERRECTEAENDEALAGFQRWTIEGWNANQPQARRDCRDHPKSRRAIELRWRLWGESNPGRSYDEFEQSGGTVVDDTCDDPRLAHVDLCARDRAGVVVGMASLINIEELTQTEDVLTVRAMPMPGFPPGRHRHTPQAWGVFSRYVLENDLEFVDGTKLEVAELRFPDSEDSDSIPRDGNGMTEMWGEILGASAALGFTPRSAETPNRVRATTMGDRRPGRTA